MYILDSSAIAMTLKRLKERSIEALKGKTILDLARYELGDIIWRGCALKNIISAEEALNEVENVAKVLKFTIVKGVGSSEEFKGVMELAVKLKLTFCDAAYLYVAKANGFTLVTEDKEPNEKAADSNVKAMTVDEFLSEGVGA